LECGGVEVEEMEGERCYGKSDTVHHTGAQTDALLPENRRPMEERRRWQKENKSGEGKGEGIC
jgi:hypothetical protein